jgi:hypothetical protein
MHGFGITDPTFLQLGPRKKTAKLGQAEQSFRANSTTEALGRFWHRRVQVYITGVAAPAQWN